VLDIALSELRSSERVTDVRVTGLLGAVQLREPRSREVVTAMIDRGFLLRALDADSVAVSPAFVATDDQVRDLAAALKEVVGQ
jgi:adenosylmethionine-8-amino-7-oxononanoate aminotransferase